MGISMVDDRPYCPVDIFRIMVRRTPARKFKAVDLIAFKQLGDLFKDATYLTLDEFNYFYTMMEQHRDHSFEYLQQGLGKTGLENMKKTAEEFIRLLEQNLERKQQSHQTPEQSEGKGGRMNKVMDDMIIKLYELNEHYHDTKEKMAWLGSALYFTFSLAIMRILFIKEMQNFIKQDQWVPWIIGILLAAICGCALWFVNLHYKKKRISIVP